jgi:hypothetical protein
MNQTLFLVLVSLGSTIVGCGNNASPDPSPSVAKDGGARIVPTDSDFDAATSQATEGSARIAASCPVLAKNYDRSCTADNDCINVEQTLVCPANICSFCTTGAISKSGAAQYQADFEHVTAAVRRDSGACNCPVGGYACCRAGVCELCPPSG